MPKLKNFFENPGKTVQEVYDNFMDNPRTKKTLSALEHIFNGGDDSTLIAKNHLMDKHERAQQCGDYLIKYGIKLCYEQSHTEIVDTNKLLELSIPVTEGGSFAEYCILALAEQKVTPCSSGAAVAVIEEVVAAAESADPAENALAVETPAVEL